MSQSQEIFKMKTPFGVKTVDCTYEMPTGYGAGYSKDGETVYLDCRLKRIFKLKDGRLMDTTKYLVFHESGEKFYEDKYGYKYPYAHEKVTGLERKEVESDKFPWDEYQQYSLKEIKLIKKLDADAPMPENFDDKPERDSHDYSLIKTMQKHQKYEAQSMNLRLIKALKIRVTAHSYKVISSVETLIAKFKKVAAFKKIIDLGYFDVNKYTSKSFEKDINAFYRDFAKKAKIENGRLLVWRIIRAESYDKIDFKNLGCSWTWDKNSINSAGLPEEEHRQISNKDPGAENYWVFAGSMAIEDIDFFESLVQNLTFPHEKEINTKSLKAKIAIREIYNWKNPKKRKVFTPALIGVAKLPWL